MFNTKLIPLVSSSVPVRTRRGALIADDETKEQMRKAIENTALAVTGVMKVKKKADLYSKKVLGKTYPDTSSREESGNSLNIHNSIFFPLTFYLELEKKL